MKQLTALVLVILVLSAALGWTYLHLLENRNMPALYPHIRINEVMPSNSNTVADGDGDFSDWIELYNSGGEAVDLSGWYLSDTKKELLKWRFPDGVSIDSNSFLLLWASGKDKVKAGDSFGLHTNFSLSSDGGTIILTAPDGKTDVDFIKFKAVTHNVSYGRNRDGQQFQLELAKTSPGASNNGSGSYLAKANMLKFSHNGGFYAGELSLKLSSSDPNVLIHYTLDGSEPTELSPVFEEAIAIRNRKGEPNLYTSIQTAVPKWWPSSEETFKATVVKARAYNDGIPVSDVITNTYFVSEDMAHRYMLPVLSISLDEADLFDNEKGIYVPGAIFSSWKLKNDTIMPTASAAANYNQTGREWERPGYMEFYETDGQRVLSQGIGIRIHGGGSSAQAQKSLRLYARSEYDFNNKFYYEVFPGLKGIGTGLPISEYKRLILRNSGNDWEYSMFRDALMQSLVDHTKVAVQGYRPTVVFINGEFWGIHNIRQRYDRYYLESNYGASPNKVTILDNNGVLSEGQSGDEQAYKDMIHYIDTHDMSLDENIKILNTMMDIDNYLDYFIANTYYSNTDWPQNNVKLWRYKGNNKVSETELDGRWRWMIYDTDFGFGNATKSSFNSLKWALNPVNPSTGEEWPAKIILALLENGKVRQDFINRFADHLNTSFEPDRIIAVIDEIQAQLEPSMEEHIKRWNTNGGSIDDWFKNVDEMRNFAKERPGFVKEHIIDTFSLNGTAKVIVSNKNTRAGTIKVNSIVIDTDTPGVSDNRIWTGEYFKGIPIVIEAIAKPGYKFAGWEEPYEANDGIIITALERDITLTANFKPQSSVNIIIASMYTLAVLFGFALLYGIKHYFFTKPL